MPRFRPAWFLTAILLLAAAAPPTGAKNAALRDWVDGPIRYIAQRDEMKVFKKLKGNDERALFIERFWARRDPSPNTLANEYRQLFWERVTEANTLFLDSHKPGWMTDRGKIHILYGPPTKIDDLVNMDTHTGPTAGRGLIRWIYEGRPEGRMDMSPVVIVPFVRETTGEYRVSYDPKLSSVFFDELAVEEEWDRGIERFMEIFGAPRATEMSVMLDLGRMQEVPPQAQVLLERVETVESYGTHVIDARLDRYRHPDGGMLAVVTVDVSAVPADTPPAVIARFRPRDAQLEQRMLGEDTFLVTTTGSRRVAQGRLLLTPGDYDLTVLVADPSSASTGMRRSSFTIPEIGDVLRLSDIVWADELAPLAYAAMASHDEPFLVGPFRVVPSFSDLFRPGDTLKLFFEIYGGQAPFRVSYHVEGLELSGEWVQLGAPATTVQSGIAQGWELPTTTTWPVGAYRIRIEVVDADERSTTNLIDFHLSTEEAATPDAAEGGPPGPGSAP